MTYLSSGITSLTQFINSLSVMIAGSFILILVSGCASTGSPSGGPKDVIPPKMDSLRSAQNRSINFKPHLLEFFFDEFVEVRDPIKEVLVSPPLTYIPQVKHRAKKVTFAFDEKEILRENATYTINFGESIVDFHEGNKLRNFNYVFATGPVLDSMTFRGKIVDALTGEPDKDMVVFLYDNLTDSVVAKEKPFYFSRPDNTGIFIFQNVKSDTFKLIAIKDENINYKYDLYTEKIAFHDEPIILKDTTKYDITLISSLPKPSLKVLSFDTKTYGKVNVLYNTVPPSPPLCRIPTSGVRYYSEISGDSVNVYYETALDSFTMLLYGDTIKVKPKGKQDFLKKSSLKMISTNGRSKILSTDSLVFRYNYPVDINPNKEIIITDEIGQLENIDFGFSDDKRSIIISYPWTPGEEYHIYSDTNTVQSIYGHVGDSLNLDMKVLFSAETASIKFIITDLDSTNNYIINILKDKTLKHTTRVAMQKQVDILLKGLVPDRYNVEIFQDLNNNGIWDSADYWQKRQAEPYKLFKGTPVRENKETEINISWKTKIDYNNTTQPQGLNLPPVNIKK